MIERFLELFARLVIAVEILAAKKDDSIAIYSTMAEAVAPVVVAPVVAAPVAPTVAAPVAVVPVVAAPPVVTAPVVAAPVAAAVATPSDANPFYNPNLVMDSFHHYWDAEIHTEVRSKNADGSWKLKRGIDREKAAEKLRDQDFLFLQATGRSATEAAQAVPTLHSTKQVEDDEVEDAPVIAPPIVQAPMAPKTVRVPEHGDCTQFTKQEIIDLLGDCFVAYGDSFNAEYSKWLKESSRPGMSYASIDDGAISWFAFKTLEFLKNV
jgi:hypothetical protein